MKKSEKNMVRNTAPRSAFTLLFTICLMLVMVPWAKAETTEALNFRVSSYINKIVMSPVGDVDGHQADLDHTIMLELVHAFMQHVVDSLHRREDEQQQLVLSRLLLMLGSFILFCLIMF